MNFSILIAFWRQTRLLVHDRNVFESFVVSFGFGLCIQIDRKSGFVHQHLRRNWSRHGVNHTTVGSSEVAGDVSTILVDSAADLDGAKVADLLVC